MIQCPWGFKVGYWHIYWPSGSKRNSCSTLVSNSYIILQNPQFGFSLQFGWRWMTLVRYNLRCHRSTSWPFKVFEIRAWKVLATFEATWKPRWMPLWTLQMRFAFLGVNKGQWKTSQGYPTMCILPLPIRPNDTRSWGQWERGWLKKSAKKTSKRSQQNCPWSYRTVGAFVLLTFVIISIYSNMFDTLFIVCNVMPGLLYSSSPIALDHSNCVCPRREPNGPRPYFSLFDSAYSFLVRNFPLHLPFLPDDWIVGETPKYVFIFGMIFWETKIYNLEYHKINPNDSGLVLHGHGRWSYRLLEVLNGEAIPVILADGWQLPLDAWPRCRWQMLFGFFGCFAWDEVNQKWLLNWNAICILEISGSVIDLKLLVFLIYLHSSIYLCILCHIYQYEIYNYTQFYVYTVGP